VFTLNTSAKSVIMAEAASNVPTFKLVLVGDGGTGKVSCIDLVERTAAAIHPAGFIPATMAHSIRQRHTNI
jgi:hypothetical protein